MTNNNGCGHHKSCESDRDFAKCKPKHPKPSKVLLECGEGTGSRTFTSSNDTPFQIAHVSLDTTCLNKPEVLIKFSSQVRVERLDSGATVRLQYELLRVCEDGAPISLGIWRFEKVNISNAEFNRVAEESFNFIFCECSNCPRCCEYFVKVTPVEITNTRVTVCNGRMAAVAQSVCDSKDDSIEIQHRSLKYRETILECGQGTGNAIFTRQDEPPVRIADVTVDTSHLCGTEVMVEFSSIISFLVRSLVSSTVRLQFELFRVSDNDEPVSRGIWIFEVDSTRGDIPSKAFSFIFCECATLLSCCEYFVIVTPIQLEVQIVDSVMVTDLRISALAQSDMLCDKRDDIGDYELNNHKPKKLLLECGHGTGSRTFTTSSNSGFQLSHVTIDTRHLCKPKVNIEFSNIINYESMILVGLDVLRYELFRICDDGQPELRGVWTYRRLRGDDILTSSLESFDFTFCESIKCKADCCIYFVTVTPIEIQDQVTVSNGRMAALAQGR